MGMLTTTRAPDHSSTPPILLSSPVTIQEEYVPLHFRHFITLFFCLIYKFKILTTLSEPRRAASHDLTLAHQLGVEL
jgi:hypothetical protein